MISTSITENSTSKPSTEHTEIPTHNPTEEPTKESAVTSTPTFEVTNKPTNNSANKPTIKPTETFNPQFTPDIGNSEVVGSTTEADNAAKNIIKASEKFNTTDNVFSALDDFWSNPKKFFLDEKYKTSYPLILTDLDQKTNGAHNQIRKFYNNTAIFFSLNKNFVFSELPFSGSSFY